MRDRIRKITAAVILGSASCTVGSRNGYSGILPGGGEWKRYGRAG